MSEQTTLVISEENEEKFKKAIETIREVEREAVKEASVADLLRLQLDAREAKLEALKHSREAVAMKLEMLRALILGEAGVSPTTHTLSLRKGMLQITEIKNGE